MACYVQLAGGAVPWECSVLVRLKLSFGSFFLSLFLQKADSSGWQHVLGPRSILWVCVSFLISVYSSVLGPTPTACPHSGSEIYDQKELTRYPLVPRHGLQIPDLTPHLMSVCLGSHSHFLPISSPAVRESYLVTHHLPHISWTPVSDTTPSLSKFTVTRLAFNFVSSAHQEHHLSAKI